MDRKLEAALMACGAVLLRQKRHKVYLLPNGRRFIVGATPSDWRAATNNLTKLKRRLACTPSTSTGTAPAG